MTATMEERLAPLYERGHLLGWSAQPGTVAAYEQVERDVIGAKGQVRRVFRGDYAPDIAAGRIPFVEVFIGSNYREVTDKAASFAPHPVVLTVGHEEERRDKAHTAAWFRDNYSQAFPILAEAPNAIIGSTWMNFSAKGQNSHVGSRDQFYDWLPARGEAHFLAFDLYVHSPGKPDSSPRDQMRWPMQAAIQQRVPLMYAEFAIAGTAQQRAVYAQAWIDEVDQLRGDGCHCAPLLTCWFSSRVGANVPVVHDGSRTWAIGDAYDMKDVLTPKVWADRIAR